MIIFEVDPGVPTILSNTGTLISAILGWLSQFTTWILGNPLAVMFFAIMFVMLGIHVLHSLVHKFS